MRQICLRNVGYTAQQWPLFLRALRDHEEKTGEALTIPSGGTLPFRFYFSTYVRRQEVPKGKTLSEMTRGMTFYVRKGLREAIDLPLRFRLSRPGSLRITGPTGEVIVETRLEGEVKGRRRTMGVEYGFRLPEDAAPGDYRIELAMPQGRYFDTVLPWRGRYSKLVADARPLMRFYNGSRFYFMPRLLKGAKQGRFRLRFGISPDRYFLVSRVWGPDGSLRDAQSQPPQEPLHEITFGPDEDLRLWLHTRGYGPNAYAELSGDVFPVISFTRESFFVPGDIRARGH